MLVISESNEQFVSNPYPFYRKLHSKGRFHFQKGDGGTEPDRWYFTHYDDIVHVLKDKRFGRENLYGETGASEVPTQFQILADINKGVMLHRDPPEHTRLRSLVSKAFTPGMVRRLRPNIEQLCDELLDVMQEKEQVDFIEDFAMPLPVMVISDMLGVPKEDRELVKQWSHALARTLEPGATLSDGTDGIAAGMEFIQYLQQIFNMRRKQPQQDLISVLLEVEEQGERLTTSELYATCILLLAAGHETTTNLIGNGLYALAQHPDELKKLQEHPDLTPSAVEEILRYESPIQRTGRVAVENIELFGQEIKRGQILVTLLGSANRDPAKFTDPDTFKIERKPNQHVSFGMGIHFCLGASLARLEGDVALRKLLSRFSRLEIGTANPNWHQMVVFRGLKNLHGIVQ